MISETQDWRKCLGELDEAFLSRVVITASISAEGTMGLVGGIDLKAKAVLMDAVAEHIRELANLERMQHKTWRPYYFVTSREDQVQIPTWLQRPSERPTVIHVAAENFDEMVRCLRKYQSDERLEGYLKRLREEALDRLFPLLHSFRKDPQSLWPLYVAMSVSGFPQDNEQRFKSPARAVYKAMAERGWKACSSTPEDAETNPKSLAAQLLGVVEIALRFRVMNLREGLNSVALPNPPLGGVEKWRVQFYRDVVSYMDRSPGMALEQHSSLFAALGHCPHSMILSSAGGGKSTSALALAIHGVNARLGRPEAPQNGSVSPEALIETEALTLVLREKLPVLVLMRDQAWESLSRSGSSQQFEALLGNALGIRGTEEREKNEVLRRCRNGEAFIIFEGLDELSGSGDIQQRRTEFREALHDFLRENARSRNFVVVTSRPEATEASGWQPNENFPHHHLMDFDESLQAKFLENYFRVFPESNYVDTLRWIQSCGMSVEARNPLLLTVLATLKADPESRSKNLATAVEALNEIVDLLLLRWEEKRQSNDGKSNDKHPIKSWFHDAQVSPDLLLPLLRRLASRALIDPTHQGKILAGKLAAGLKELWQVSHKRRDEYAELNWSDRVEKALVRKSGIIKPSGDGHEFAIWTLRNLLAGQHRFCERRVTESQTTSPSGIEFAIEWHRSICNRRRPRSPSQTQDALTLANVDHEAQALSLGMEWTIMDRGNPIPSRSMFALFFQAFLREAERTEDAENAYAAIALIAEVALRTKSWLVPEPSHPQFFQCGECELDGDNWMERTRVVLQKSISKGLQGERRGFAASLIGSLSQPKARGERPDIEWCAASAGMAGVSELRSTEIRLGDEHSWGGGAMRAVVILPYYVSRIPVTVAQYDSFVEEGYDSLNGERHWKHGWTPWENKIPRPGHLPTMHPRWRTAVYQTPNHPRISVSWYEAMAYCEWASEKFLSEWVHAVVPKEMRNLPWRVRLPTEPEWEFVARDGPWDPPPRKGKDIRVPWGWADEEGIRTMANCEGRMYFTSAVGEHLFPANRCGKSTRPRGEELVGNVLEWCWTTFQGNASTRAYPLAQDYDAMLCRGGERVVRGGSWSRSAVFCRCAYRNARLPDVRGGNLGFRLILAPDLTGQKQAQY